MERWTAVLEAFLTRDEWGVRDLAVFVALSPSATHRILHEMVRNGLLTSAAEAGRFVIGPEAVRLSVLLAERVDVRRIARPFLEGAARLIGETVILALYSPTRQRFWAVDAVESEHTISYIWESLRSWSDLHRGASGKGILAFLPADEREAIITSVDPSEQEDLRAALDVARSQGYVISHGERFDGAIGVAAPVRDATGRVIGDILSGWPDNRNAGDKEQVVVAHIVEASASLSRALGYRHETETLAIEFPDPA